MNHLCPPLADDTCKNLLFDESVPRSSTLNNADYHNKVCINIIFYLTSYLFSIRRNLVQQMEYRACHHVLNQPQV